MSAQPEPHPTEGSGGSTALFRPDPAPPGPLLPKTDPQPIRPRASAVVLPLRPQAAIPPSDEDVPLDEVPGDRTGAAWGLLLGVVLGAALWLLIGVVVWRLLRH